jgi:ribosomal silencing factor RsfS
VFLSEAREFYELERLWADVERWAWQDSPEIRVLSPLA